MVNNFCETRSLELLARFDFLDVCLLGETGTGKTHLARRIHDMSPRAERAFVVVNCAELTPSIIEAELFGYEKGAFTGATAAKEGKFELAAGGTLFLDEIGELPADLQGKLLKVVEEKIVTRVGGNRPRSVDVRIIYATHRDLSVLREDLRYRVAAHPLYLKPLRERREEIVPLASLLLLEFSRKSGRVFKASDETLKLLETSEWRGNVRELRSFIEKACLDALFIADEDGAQMNEIIELTVEFLPARLSTASAKPALPPQIQKTKVFSLCDKFPMPGAGEKMEEYLEKIERHLLRKALDAHDNNQTRAARELGISRSGLIKKLKRINH